MDIVESLTRWLHVIAGIMWIGHLWFFNFVNANFAPTMDGETKKKVVPELMPRALYMFRMGALFTWITGVMLLGLVFYMNHFGLTIQGAGAEDFKPGPLAMVFVALTFIAPFLYDFLASGPLKDPTRMFWIGWGISTVLYLLMRHLGGFTYRGAAIHLGALFGTIMAYNVWFRIWPNQRQIIRGIVTGEAAAADLVATAGLRSKHNTYMSFPLVFTMLNAHSTWAAFGGDAPGKFSGSDLLLPVVVLVAWLLVYHIYEVAKKEGPKFY